MKRFDVHFSELAEAALMRLDPTGILERDAKNWLTFHLSRDPYRQAVFLRNMSGKSLFVMKLFAGAQRDLRILIEIEDGFVVVWSVAVTEQQQSTK